MGNKFGMHMQRIRMMDDTGAAVGSIDALSGISIHEGSQYNW